MPDENVTTDPRWQAFVTDLQRFVVDLPSDVPPGLRIDAQGPLSHVQRTGLRFAATQMRDDLDPRAIRAASRLHEIYALVISGATSRPDPVNGANRTANVGLRPIEQSDIPVLYRAAFDPSEGPRWRFRGRGMGHAEFASSLFAGVLSQFVVAAPDGRAVGLVCAYEASLEAGHAKVAMLSVNQRRGSATGLVTEGLALFVEYLFRAFPLKKLYAEVPDYNRYLIDGLPGLLETEGRLRDYVFLDGLLHDLIVASISRERWTAFVQGMDLPTGEPMPS